VYFDETTLKRSEG